MILWNCTFSSMWTWYINDLNCDTFSWSIDVNLPVYTWEENVYRAWFLWDDWAYYVSQNLLFSILIWFWSIFFVAFTIIALSIKFFKLWIKK